MYGFQIRRLLPPRPPGPAPIAEKLVPAGHSAGTTLSSRSPGGLGRDLAGILDDAGSAARNNRSSSSGLKQLLGRGISVTPPRVRQFVTEIALGAIADGFGAEAVAIARLDDDDHPVVASRIPPSWGESPSLTFELYGQLWGLLERRGLLLDTRHSRRPRRTNELESATYHQIQLGHRPTWLGWHPTASGDLAAAVVRREPFTEAEQATLSRLVRSVAVAIGIKRSSLPPDAGMSALIRRDGDRWRAEAVVEAEGKRRRAFADADTSELAVARAAAKLCRVPTEVSFAGRTELDGTAVTLVVVQDAQNAPFLGLAVTEPDDQAGAVEAVFSAVSVMCGPGSRKRDRLR